VEKTKIEILKNNIKELEDKIDKKEMSTYSEYVKLNKMKNQLSFLIRENEQD